MILVCFFDLKFAQSLTERTGELLIQHTSNAPWPVKHGSLTNA